MSIVKKTKIQQAVSETTANQTHKLEEQRMYTQTTQLLMCVQV